MLLISITLFIMSVFLLFSDVLCMVASQTQVFYCQIVLICELHSPLGFGISS